MSEVDQQHLQELLERVFDARGDADDPALRQWIASRPAAEQTHCEQLVLEIGSARAAVADVAVPAGLETQLSQIASAAPVWQLRDLLQYQLKKWQIVVALGLIALAVGISIWPTEPPRAPVLDDRTVQLVSNSAIKHQAKTLSLASSDAVQVLAMLKGEHLPFEPKLPAVQRAVTLEGASIVRFGNALAIQTKWHGASGNFTLYQFDSKALKVPGGFSTVIATLGTPAQSIMIWPGHNDAYAWALVGSAGCEENPFCEGYSGE